MLIQLVRTSERNLMQRYKSLSVYNALALKQIYFLHGRLVCLCVCRVTSGWKWMTAAPNYIKTHSGKEHHGFSTVMEAMHQFECPAIDLQRGLHNHSGERPGDPEILVVTRSDELHPSTTNSARWEEAITEEHIHHPAATGHNGKKRN